MVSHQLKSDQPCGSMAARTAPCRTYYGLLPYHLCACVLSDHQQKVIIHTAIRLFMVLSKYVLSLKMLRLEILVTFADHRCLLHFLSSSQSIKDRETATILFQEDISVYI